MKKDIIFQPVELIDQDLDLIAGGDLTISTNVDVAVINQLIIQIEALGTSITQSATNVAGISGSLSA